jgi:hypothetical protein
MPYLIAMPSQQSALPRIKISLLVVIEVVSTTIESRLRMGQNDGKLVQSESDVYFVYIAKSLLIINGILRSGILPITMKLMII